MLTSLILAAGDGGADEATLLSQAGPLGSIGGAIVVLLIVLNKIQAFRADGLARAIKTRDEEVAARRVVEDELAASEAARRASDEQYDLDRSDWREQIRRLRTEAADRDRQHADQLEALRADFGRRLDALEVARDTDRETYRRALRDRDDLHAAELDAQRTATLEAVHRAEAFRRQIVASGGVPIEPPPLNTNHV